MGNATPSLSTDLPAVPWDRVERFVGQLTHDIRNGLNALELQLTFLGEISTDPEAVDEIKRIRGSMGTITRQLQTLRNATGISTSYPLEYPAQEFFEDLRERLAKLHPGMDEKIAWEFALPPDASLVVDPELTIGALLELLTNAIQFAPDGVATIRALVSTEGGHVIFALEERHLSPPVVPTQDWGRTPLLTTRRGAYGLGLFRVRRCLESQGCVLEASYDPETKLLTTKAMLRGELPSAP